MKKKIILKRLFHNDEKRLAVLFDYDNTLIERVKSIKGIRWSQSNGCFHAPDDENHLKQIISVFREIAEIDISSISSVEREKVSVPEKVLKNIKQVESSPPKVITENRTKDDYFIPQGRKEKKSSVFDPVLFTISEKEGGLIIRFTGKYDQEWVDELRTYGKPFYDKISNEWILEWSQLAVDSLSDYFSQREVDVVIKKKALPAALAGIREVQGSEVRGHRLGNEALEGIEVLRRHLEEKRYSERTIVSYLASLELFFKYFHEKKPFDIRGEDVSEFIEDHILKLGYSASYQNIMVSAIKMFYSLSGRRRVDPDTLQRPRRSRALPKVFSKEEIMKIFSATRNNKHKLILWLIYSCGLRRSEVVNIKLTDLETERGILKIREGKGNKDRMVPIPKKVWEKIAVYIKSYNPKEYLFEGQAGGRYSVESVYSVFKRSLRLAGIQKDVGVHSLRHSYATHLHEGGLDIRYIQELLGHNSSRTTEIYTHVSRRNLFAIRSPIEDMELD